jgi:RNA polymerase sigma-70 factor (ECF subfamily)
MYSKCDDRELVELLKQNNHAAYNEIYRRYWKKMLLVAWNHSRNEYIAKDIVQEVFINLWEKHHAYDIQSLPAFLATVVKFEVFKAYQKETRRSELAKQNYQFKDVVYDEELLDARFLQDTINGIVEEMPERCRIVFHYSRNMGLKNTEIAEKEKIAEKTVENTLTRALKIIRKELKNHGFPLMLLMKLLILLKL